MPKLEIERKFILKALPKRKYDDILTIDQYYWKNNKGIWERARTYHSEINGDSYIHTIKTPSKIKGGNYEQEKEMTSVEFNAFKDRCLHTPTSKYIQKERIIYKEGELKWEVDLFDNGYRLIIAEIEIPRSAFKLTIPDYIQDVLLLEVTGLRQFSNRSLSLNISEINKYK